VVVDSEKLQRLIEENKLLKQEIRSLKSNPVQNAIPLILETISKIEKNMEGSPLGFLTFDEDGTILNCNTEFAREIGARREQLIGLNMLTQLKDEALKKAVRSAIETGTGTYEGIYKSVLSGKETPGRVFFSSFFDETKSFIHGIGISQNLSKGYQAEKELHKMEGTYQSLFQNFNAAIYIQDQNGLFLDVNPMVETMYGYPKEYFIGKSPEFISAPGKNDFTEVKEKIEMAFNGSPQQFEFWGLKKNGEIFPKEVRVVPGIFKGEKVIIAFAQDITERHREQRLKEFLFQIARASQLKMKATDLYDLIREKLSEFIDTENLFIGILDKKGTRLRIPYMVDENDNLEDVPVEGTISAIVMKHKTSLRLSKSEILAMEERGIIGDVGTPCKSWLGVPLLIDKEVFGTMVIQNYNRENAYSESDLKLMEYVSSQIAISIRHIASKEWISKLTEAVEQSPVALMIADANCIIEYVNHAQVEMTGSSKDQLIGQVCTRLVNSQDIDGCPTIIYQEVQKKSPWQTELRLKGRHGAECWNSLTVSTILNEKEDIQNYLVLSEDVTEKVRLRQQLIQAQKMESVGTLAGGIAHDFNNLLTVVNGNAELLIDELQNDTQLQAHVIQILKSGIKAKEMTSKLLAFSRKQIFNPHTLDWNSVMQDQLSILRRLIGEDIEISLNLDSSLPPVKADPVQISQILMNLVVNGRDAIQEMKKAPDKQITISTSLFEVDNTFALEHPGCAPGPHILCSIRDTGKGMEPHVLNKIFDPFYTTKEQGKGTGLGLATVYGIVKQNHGYIEIESHPDRGTNVKIYWPTSSKKISVELNDPGGMALLSTMPLGSERILLVEDDPDVLNFSKTILERSGYDVTTAQDGQEALEWVNERIASGTPMPEMLVTDMVMPGISGRELAQAVSGMIPGIKILYTSGYTNSQISESGELIRGLHFLQKPFTLRELLYEVRSILDEET
jgi:PAS domain S-box-containing protein